MNLLSTNPLNTKGIVDFLFFFLCFCSLELLPRFQNSVLTEGLELFIVRDIFFSPINCEQEVH